MPFVEEIPPLMVLAESSPDRMVFRFRGRMWGWITLLAGVGLTAPCVWSFFVGSPWTGSLAVVASFGLVLFFSSLYSFTAEQFLVVDGATRSLQFHKRNLYGRVDWER